jgi:tetratricopeptide (TPR) repeat protein
MNKGVYLDELKRYVKAVRCFDKALELDTHLTDAIISYGASSFRKLYKNYA